MAQIKKTETKKTKLYRNVIIRFYWLVILVIFLLSFSFEYFVIIKPKIQQTKNNGPLDLASRQVVLNEQKDYLGKLKVLKNEAENINRVELEKINYVLAEKINVSDILKQISIISQQPKFNLEGFSYKYGEGVLIFNFNFVGGTYQDVKKFLEEIEKNIRVMDVTNIAIKNAGDGFSLVIKSYYLE
ncbi:MAG: hypothetical protein PHW15_02925 [Patescibacteria group bacterium]|jgi:hypothetical protein|nr:hypothetical protein [Patescibacteria group bacterium]MDD5172836.1 hypothetical protein [Patescibacteria group bacterium]